MAFWPDPSNRQGNPLALPSLTRCANPACGDDFEPRRGIVAGGRCYCSDACAGTWVRLLAEHGGDMQKAFDSQGKPDKR